MQKETLLTQAGMLWSKCDQNIADTYLDLIGICSPYWKRFLVLLSFGKFVGGTFNSVYELTAKGLHLT